MGWLCTLPGDPARWPASCLLGKASNTLECAEDARTTQDSWSSFSRSRVDRVRRRVVEEEGEEGEVVVDEPSCSAAAAAGGGGQGEPFDLLCYALSIGRGARLARWLLCQSEGDVFSVNVLAGCGAPHCCSRRRRRRVGMQYTFEVVKDGAGAAAGGEEER